MSDDQEVEHPPQTIYSTESIIEAIHEAKGMVTVAAELIGCDPSTIHRRAREEEKIQAALDHEREHIDDVAELKLFEAIKAGEPWAIRLRLKQGAGRDYKERIELGPEDEGETKKKLKRTLTGQEFDD